MLTQQNILKAVNSIPQTTNRFEESISALNTALNIITPDAKTTYTFVKHGGSHATPTMTVILGVEFIDSSEQLTLKYSYKDGAMIVDILDLSVKQIAMTSEQIVELAAIIHRQFINKKNPHTYSVTLNGLTELEKQAVIAFAKDHLSQTAR